MALLAAQTVSIAGTQATYTAAAGGGDTLAPNDHAYLHVKNGGGSPITVTVVVPGNTKYGQAAPDVPVVVTNATEKFIGPFPPDLADPITGLVGITYSAVTTVTVAVVTH